jgi:hypothetical protein
MRLRVASVTVVASFSCVPAGNSAPGDAGASATSDSSAATIRQAASVMTTVFEDSFERPSGALAASLPPNAAVPGEGGASEPAKTNTLFADAAGAGDGPLYAQNGGLGMEWHQAATNVWHIEGGRLCGQNAHNHGVWLRRTLPVNARIEFDAISDSPDGDLKAEVWGDGQSAATSLSYTNATSYLTVLGGWKNTFHVLARMNEHGTDRKEIKIDPSSDDPREKPVTRGQSYHFKIERTDGKTVHWSVDGIEYLSYADSQPLAGIGHDHFGFNDWEVKVCFDNVKVTPLK